MNIRTTLMLMAATVAAPVYAQQPAEVFTTLSAPSTVQATAEQRAAAMPALAVMPADTEVCYTVTNLPALFDSIHNAGMMSDRDYESMPEEVKAVHSVAIGAGAGSGKTLEALSSIYSIAMYNEGGNDVLRNWAKMAVKEYQGALEELADKTAKATIADFKTAISEIKVGPAYGVLVGTAGSEAMLQEWYNSLVEELQEEDGDNGFAAVNVNGFSGIKVQMPAEEAEPSEWDDEYDIAMKQEVVKRTVYLLFKLEGNKIIAAVCENPEDIKLPATAQDSVLGTGKLAAADAKLDKGLHMVGYASAEATNAYKQMMYGLISRVGNDLVNGFKALEAQGGENGSRFAAAAKGAETILTSIRNYAFAAGKNPTFGMASWSGSDMEFELAYDSTGVAYKPGKLSLLKQAADPNTVLYAESTYWNNPNSPDLNQLIDCGLAVCDGVITTLPTAQQDEAEANMQMVKAFLPEVKEAIASFSLVTEGMDNTMGLVVDGNGTMPAVLGGKPGNTTAFPRIAFYSGVADRAKLSEGWDSILTVAGKVATKVGSDPAILNMLPIIPRTIGKSTSYSVALPMFTENLVPNITVSDSAFVLGSSSALNAEIAESATGTMDYTGCVCSIKFAPLAKMLRSIATDLQARAEAEAPKTEPAKPAAPAPVVVEMDEEEEFDEDGDYIPEDDFDEEEIYAYHYREPSPAESRANNADDAADAAEAIAEYVDSVNMTATTKDGSFIIRAQVKLNK